MDVIARIENIHYDYEVFSNLNLQNYLFIYLLEDEGTKIYIQ